MKGYVENLIASYPDMVRRRDYLKREIDNLCKNQVTDIDIIESMTYARPDGDRVQTSGPSDKVAMIAIVYQERVKKANAEVLRYCRKEYANLCAEINYLEAAVGSLKGEEREVMDALLIDRITWEEAEYILGMSHSSLQRIRKKAINSMVRFYQRRESEYICELLG